VTTMADRVPLERIGRRARAAHPGRTVVVSVLAVLFGLGWVAYKTLALAWLGAAWTGAAVAEGWVAAREDSRRRQVKRGTARAG